MVDVLIRGFKTVKQAEAFAEWYEGGAEQFFDEHLQEVGLGDQDGCYVKVYGFEGKNTMVIDLK